MAITTTVPAAATAVDLAAQLRSPVWNALADRAETLRRALPSRPESGSARYQWLRSLSPEQARTVALLERLEALCGHLSGCPAPGFAPDDPLPEAALEEADGFTNAVTAELMTTLRALRRGSAADGVPARPT
ncbi:hypothetical protein ACH41H_24365 [Streptomyces sp. NPDC020800]|uniref:hypothetical protein n=1 Tax=Streptomyces sp. NPDC020800 TaxID=3365092 RepID=UPI00378F930F